MKQQTETIKILYTSDIHGSVLPISYGTNKYANVGLAKYATLVKQARETYKNLLVLDNGDLIQGTPLMTHYMKNYRDNENPMIAIMNRLNIDASVIGNHEFNYGKQVLERAVTESTFPWLAANIIDESTNEPAFGPPYIIKEFQNNIRVAIIGVTTHYIPNWEEKEHIEGLVFNDASKTLKKWVKHIHKIEQPHIVIASYHGGFERDLQTGEPTEPLTGENQGYDMCANIDGIDVLLTGHQHRVLSDAIYNVTVIQPGKDATHYGEITIELVYEKDWKIQRKKGEVKPISNIEPDQDILQYIKPLEQSTQKWLDQPVGTIEGNMLVTDPLQARMKKHPLVEFIQNVQMEASGVDISVTSLFNDPIGFDSVVTMRDIVANYMYPNTLVVLQLSGSDIIQALEQSAAYFTLDQNGEITVDPAYISPKPQHYNYDMWEGIEYTINVSKPVGHRISDVTYHDEPICPDKQYDVVLNNYRANGGGNYHMFQGKPVVKEIQKDAVELIAAYFEKHKVIYAKATPNFVVKK